MTDYWKSYAKKFCEICKCWYADNKISIERHEMGERHKAMVQQRIRESAKKAKDKEIADHDVRMTIYAMEQAARASMSSGSQREVPIMPEDESFTNADYPGSDKPAENDPKEILKEQKRKLKELKRTAKQSQFWVEDKQDQIFKNNEEVPQKNAKFEHLPEQTYSMEQVAVTSVTSDIQHTVPLPKLYSITPKVTYQTFAGATKTKDIVTNKYGNANRVTEYKRELPEEIILQPLDKVENKEPESEEASTSNHKHPYGPWIPVTNNVTSNQGISEKSTAAEHTKRKHYDDLPEQEYGPGTKILAQAPAELLEIAEIDPEELAFKQKELSSEQIKKKSKIVGFRHPTSNSTNKSLRDRKSTNL